MSPRRTGGDRGMASIEAFGYITMSIFAFIVAVQLMVWGLAALGAHYTAGHAAETSRLYGSSTAAGYADAATMLDSAAGAGLADARVTVNRGPATTTVTITGHASTIVPGLRPPVTVTVIVPTERTN